MKTNSTVTQLDLHSDENWEWTDWMLLKFFFFFFFFFFGKKIGVEGGRVLREGIKRNCTLTWLNLGCDAKMRIENWKKYGKHCFVQLTANQIGDDGASLIYESLKANSSLVGLCLWCDDQRESDACFLKEKLKPSCF